MVWRLELSNIVKVLFFAGVIACSASVSAAELKIGYVQVDKILKEAPQTSESGKKLEKEFSPRSLELDKVKKQIADIESSLDKEGLTLTNAERRKRQRQASSLKVEFSRKQRELREDINIRKNEELSILQDRINNAVRTVSEKNGYDLVMYGGVAYASNKIDITDKVLKLLSEK
jgi:outer membrane protein